MWNNLIEAISKPLDTVLDKVITDKNAREQAKEEYRAALMNSDTQIALAQAAVNAEEAKSDKWWKSGWRPFIGWVCGTAMVNNFILLPYVAALGLTVQPMDWAAISPILVGMLGLGGMRTAEKYKGVA